MDYPHWLLVGFIGFWSVLAIRPHDRVVWMTENVLTVAVVIALVATFPAWPLSDLAYTLIAGFLILHTAGGHYTYARVPIMDACFGRILGAGTDGRRNHYDRWVHFAYGLFIAYPLYEMLERYAQPVGAWSYVLSPALIMASSMAFEVVEWWAAELLGAGAGSEYLGTQGDEWDAQKDMALATAGAIIAMLLTSALA